MNLNGKWDYDYRYTRFQPTFVDKIDIKNIIDILNYKRYNVDNFRLLSVADPKMVVEGSESMEPARIYFSKDSRPFDNSNKPKGWNVYYDNGKQILEMDIELICEIRNRRSAIMNSKVGEKDDKIEPFHVRLEEISKSIWNSLREWAISL